jgi:hypothetical protein
MSRPAMVVRTWILRFSRKNLRFSSLRLPSCRSGDYLHTGQKIYANEKNWFIDLRRAAELWQIQAVCLESPKTRVAADSRADPDHGQRLMPIIALETIAYSARTALAKRCRA